MTQKRNESRRGRTTSWWVDTARLVVLVAAVIVLPPGVDAGQGRCVDTETVPGTAA